MKSFKSFDDFINESYNRSTGTKGTMPLNEALLSFLTPDQKFKVDEDKPDAKAGEIAAFHFVMKMETENPDEAKKNAANELSASTVVMNKVANNIVFIAVTKDKERSITGQQIFKGILSVRDAANYDTSKAQPFLTSANGKLKLYKAEDATKMNKDLNPPVNPEQIQVQTGTSGSSGTAGTTGTAGSAGSSGTAGTGGVFPWDWNNIDADDQILKYLTEKLLAFEIVNPGGQNKMPNGRALQTGIKVSRGVKGQEVKFVQLILKEKAFVDKYGDPAKKVQDKLGNPDGDYGPNTATAFGMFFDSKEAEHNAINANDVEYLAKYCTKVGITLARLKELWELAGKGTTPVTTSGTSGTAGTGGSSGTAGTSGQAGFIYINKPGGAQAAPAAQPQAGTEEKK